MSSGSRTRRSTRWCVRSRCATSPTSAQRWSRCIGCCAPVGPVEANGFHGGGDQPPAVDRSAVRGQNHVAAGGDNVNLVRLGAGLSAEEGLGEDVEDRVAVCVDVDVVRTQVEVSPPDPEIDRDRRGDQAEVADGNRTPGGGEADCGCRGRPGRSHPMCRLSSKGGLSGGAGQAGPVVDVDGAVAETDEALVFELAQDFVQRGPAYPKHRGEDPLGAPAANNTPPAGIRCWRR